MTFYLPSITTSTIRDMEEERHDYRVRPRSKSGSFRSKTNSNGDHDDSYAGPSTRISSIKERTLSPIGGIDGAVDEMHHIAEKTAGKRAEKNSEQSTKVPGLGSMAPHFPFPLLSGGGPMAEEPCWKHQHEMEDSPLSELLFFKIQRYIAYASFGAGVFCIICAYTLAGMYYFKGRSVRTWTTGEEDDTAGISPPCKH